MLHTARTRAFGDRRLAAAIGLTLALALSACSGVNQAIEEIVFRIGLAVTGTFGALGLWAVIACIRGPRFGVVFLVVQWLLGGMVLVLTGMGTEGFDPWPGALSWHDLVLLWLPQPLACLPIVATGRFAADRVAPAQRRRAWIATAVAVAAYLGVLARASTANILPPLDGRVVEVAVGDEDSYVRTDRGMLVLMNRRALPGRYRSVFSSDRLALAIDEHGRALRLDGLRVTVLGPLSAPVRDVAIAGARACVADAGGAVHCLDATQKDDKLVDLSLVTHPGFVDIVDLELSGDGRLCAIDARGAVTCGALPERGSPSQAPQPLAVSDARGLALTGSALCVLAAAGTVACRGDNEWAALGQPGDAPTSSETLLSVPGLVDVVQLVAGEFHVCARSRAGDVRCWGGNGWNQLGPDSLGDRHAAPVQVPLPGPASTIVAEQRSTCATLADGRIFCWGAQTYNGGLLHGEICKQRWLRSSIVCSDHPVEVWIPTTAIPPRSPDLPR
jgi:hypothetical protein